MKAPRAAVLILLAALAACASPASRIKAHQAAFDAYPPETQRNIREGKAEIGFTREQVTMALGSPGRRYTRMTAGVDEEIWVYGAGSSARPSLGIGFGMGSYGMGGGVSTGVGVESRDDGDARVRVVFRDGAAVSVENRVK